MKENRLLGVVVNSKHPWASIWNHLLVEASLWFKTSRSWGYPFHITIEPTTACNLKCPLCPTGVGTLNRPTGRMKYEQFKQVVDEIGPYLARLEIAGIGEPLLNPDLCRMIRYAADAGVWVHLDTNVILINTQEKVRDLIASGLGTLNMSIDGATQETYERYRVNGDLSAVLANLRALVQEKKHQGVDRPEIVCQVVVTRQNEHEIEDIRRMAHELGVDRFVPKSATLSMMRSEDTKEIAGTLIEKFSPRDKKFRRHRPSKELVHGNGCAALYKNAFLMWNGDLTTCCHDTHGENTRGNILESGSFTKAWNSPLYQQLRKQVNTDIRKADPLCSVCPAQVFVEDEDN